MLVLILSVLFAGSLVLRYFSMRYLAINWLGLCAIYVTAVAQAKCWDEKTKLARLMDYAAVWPMGQIMSHFWIWDFRRFVIDQESLRLVLDFFAQHPKMGRDE